MSGDNENSKRYPPAALRDSLHKLAGMIVDNMKRQGLTDEMLESEGLVSGKTLTRWYQGTVLPRTPAQIEKMFEVAQAVGISRAEAEAVLPEPSALQPVRRSATQRAELERQILVQLQSNGQALRDILEAVRRLSVQLDSHSSHRT